MELFDDFGQFEVDGGEADVFLPARRLPQFEAEFVDGDAHGGGDHFEVGVAGVEGAGELQGFVGEHFPQGFTACGVSCFRLGSAFVVCFG